MNMNEIFADMAKLAGNGRPCLLYALWGAVLSSQKPLDMNCKQAHALRPCVRNGLPTHDPDELAQWIVEHSDPNGWVYRTHADAIIRIDWLYRAGYLAHLEQEPQTGKDWIRWRKAIAQLFGLSWKTASFAAFIMWPFSTPFIPIDSHVADRLGILPIYASGKLSRKCASGYREYRKHERTVRRECRDMAQTSIIGAHHYREWVRHIDEQSRRYGVQLERNLSHELLCACI